MLYSMVTIRDELHYKLQWDFMISIICTTNCYGINIFEITPYFNNTSALFFDSLITFRTYGFCVLSGEAKC